MRTRGCNARSQLTLCALPPSPACSRASSFRRDCPQQSVLPNLGVSLRPAQSRLPDRSSLPSRRQGTAQGTAQPPFPSAHALAMPVQQCKTPEEFSAHVNEKPGFGQAKGVGDWVVRRALHRTSWPVPSFRRSHRALCMACAGRGRLHCSLVWAMVSAPRRIRTLCSRIAR